MIGSRIASGTHRDPGGPVRTYMVEPCFLAIYGVFDSFMDPVFIVRILVYWLTLLPSLRLSPAIKYVGHLVKRG